VGSEIRLLGEVEVCVGGRPIDLGHLRRRCVLAALAVSANRPVPASVLVERVWGEEAPRHARDSLYSYLSRLRQALAPSGDVHLARRPGGYVLVAEPSTVDLGRFEHLVAAARGAEDGDTAETLFARALDLWRGDAFAGMDSVWFSAARDALNRERLEAELDRTDAALLRGECGSLVAELHTRVEAHPLDERSTGQLMLTLHRNGRTAEALEQYQRIRNRLAGELGLDPGAALRRLHQRILALDPAIPGSAAARAPAAATESAAHPVPRQLPAPNRLFTGRSHELARLDAALLSRSGPSPDMATVVVAGIGGVGKTCLALRWAHLNAARFPDGQLYANLRGFDPSGSPVAPTSVVHAFLDALGALPAAIPAQLEARIGLYRSVVAGRRILVVLDNARDAAQVEPLLPGDPACAVLVTSRHQLAALVALRGARTLELDALHQDDARRLLGAHLGHARIAEAPRATRELLDCCAGLPLALSIVGARAETRPDLPLSILAEELRERATRLDMLNAGGGSADLRAVLSWSLDALDPAAAQVFAMLGLAPETDISLGAAACLIGLPVARSRALLASLEQAHLVRQHAPGRYRMHELVRLYAAELAYAGHSAEVRLAALNRLLEYCLHTAEPAGSPNKP
jgi:DNA-binding SARP family transcriptional activator